MKNICVLTVFIFFGACSYQGTLDRPIQFQNPSGFFHALAALENELKEEDYLALTDAIGYIKVIDTSSNSIDDFYSGFAGLSPNQIIAKAKALKQSNKR